MKLLFVWCQGDLARDHPKRKLQIPGQGFVPQEFAREEEKVSGIGALVHSKILLRAPSEAWCSKSPRWEHSMPSLPPLPLFSIKVNVTFIGWLIPPWGKAGLLVFSLLPESFAKSTLAKTFSWSGQWGIHVAKKQIVCFSVSALPPQSLSVLGYSLTVVYQSHPVVIPIAKIHLFARPFPGSVIQDLPDPSKENPPSKQPFA